MIPVIIRNYRKVKTVTQMGSVKGCRKVERKKFLT